MESIIFENSFLSWSFVLFGSFTALLGLGVFFISDLLFKRDKLAEAIIIGFLTFYFGLTVFSMSVVFAGIK